MAQEELFAGLELEDISVDEEGRVIITNPQVAERLKAATAAQPEGTSTNCGGCNTVSNCGPIITNTTTGCGPINTTALCSGARTGN